MDMNFSLVKTSIFSSMLNFDWFSVTMKANPELNANPDGIIVLNTCFPIS